MGPPKPIGAGRAYLIVLAGDNLGEMHDLAGEGAIVGRSPRAAIQLRDDGVSRTHARVWRDGDALMVEDLGSRNGTFVNSDRIEAATPIHDGDKIQIGHRTILRLTLYDSIDDAFERRLLEAATYDALTHAYSRRHFIEQLEMEFQFSRRHNASLALVLFDVDFLKEVNDTHGHEAGDRALVAIATEVRKHLRAEDLLGRLGGDEFAILCRATSVPTVAALADRLRSLIEALPIDVAGTVVHVTVSIGIAASTDPQFETPRDLMGAADRALYLAKAQGRNRIASHPVPRDVEETSVVASRKLRTEPVE